MIGQNKGFRKEIFFIKKFNEKYFHQFNDCDKKFLLDIKFENYQNQYFVASKPQAAREKTDVIISSSIGHKVNLSIKSGKNNSVHQEDINKFCKFLIDSGFDNQEIKNMLFFHWSDNSLDNSGEFRYGATRFRKKNDVSFAKLIHSFSRIEQAVLKRIFLGENTKYTPNYLVYMAENLKISQWHMDDVIKFHLNLKDDKHIVGNLGFQAWNAVLNRNIKTEPRRNSIQFKWTKISDDMESYFESKSRYL